MKFFILSRSFPPQNVIGAVRPYEMAKYLSKKGHEVTVFCSYHDSSVAKSFDVDLKGINVVSVPKNKIISLLDSRKSTNVVTSKFKAAVRFLSYPDSFKYAVNDYVKLIEDKIRLEGEPDYLITSSPVFSMHVAGSILKDKYPNVKWIADYRDLWAVSMYRKNRRNRDKSYENELVKKADMIVVVTNRMKEEMSEYIDDPDRIIVIRNGSDKRLIKSEFKDSLRTSIVYTGGLYGGYRDVTPLLEALKDIKSDISIDFYGSESSVVSKYIDKYQNLNIKYHDSISKTEVNDVQDKSLFLVVALGSHEFEKGVLPGKFFEYLESGRPIIALCDEDSELAEIINTNGLGIATRDSSKVFNFIDKYLKLGLCDSYEVPKELTREYQLSTMYTNLV